MIGKCICHIENLLPEDKIQVNFFIQIWKCKEFLLVRSYIIRDNAANVWQMLCIDGICLLHFFFFQQDKVNGIFSVVKSAQQSIFPIFASGKYVQFFLYIEGWDI